MGTDWIFGRLDPDRADLLLAVGAHLLGLPSTDEDPAQWVTAADDYLRRSSKGKFTRVGDIFTMEGEGVHTILRPSQAVLMLAGQPFERLLYPGGEDAFRIVYAAGNQMDETIAVFKRDATKKLLDALLGDRRITSVAGFAASNEDVARYVGGSADEVQRDLDKLRDVIAEADRNGGALYALMG